MITTPGGSGELPELEDDDRADLDADLEDYPAVSPAELALAVVLLGLTIAAALILLGAAVIGLVALVRWLP